MVTSNQRYFYLHHAYNSVDFTATGRQGVLSELIWDEQSQWPAFRYGRTTPRQAESPLPVSQKRPPAGMITLSQAQNQVPWVWDVSRPKPIYRVNQGQLQLVNQGSDQAGTFLGLVVHKGVYTLSADIVPRTGLLQSLCVYGDAQNQVGIGVGPGQLELWQIKAGKRVVVKTQQLSAGIRLITLQVRSVGGQFYELGWRTEDGTFNRLTDAPLDGSYLPRWDRAPRAGISLSGKEKGSSQVNALRLDYKES